MGTGVAGTAAVNAGAGVLAGLTNAAIDPCLDASAEYLGTSAAFGGLGGAVGSRFKTTGMKRFSQKGFPGLKGLTPKSLGGNLGKNGINGLLKGGTTSALIGAGGPAGIQETGIYE